MKKHTAAQVQERSTPATAEPAPQTRGAGIGVTMCCKTEANRWDFRADSTPDAIEKARVICQESGYHWPSDVIVWEIHQRI
jgi:hypothetical protein